MYLFEKKFLFKEIKNATCEIIYLLPRDFLVEFEYEPKEEKTEIKA